MILKCVIILVYYVYIYISNKNALNEIDFLTVLYIMII